MRTIIIYDQCGEQPIAFFVVERDLSHLNNVYVNGTEDEDKAEEIMEILNSSKTFKKFPLKKIEADTKVIVCGFLP